jgi:hypothetical protein
MELLGDVGHVESLYGAFRESVSVVQYSYMVCSNHTIGLENILNAPDGTPR